MVNTFVMMPRWRMNSLLNTHALRSSDPPSLCCLGGQHDVRVARLWPGSAPTRPGPVGRAELGPPRAPWTAARRSHDLQRDGRMGEGLPRGDPPQSGAVVATTHHGAVEGGPSTGGKQTWMLPLLYYSLFTIHGNDSLFVGMIQVDDSCINR